MENFDEKDQMDRQEDQIEREMERHFDDDSYYPSERKTSEKSDEGKVGPLEALILVLSGFGIWKLINIIIDVVKKIKALVTGEDKKKSKKGKKGKKKSDKAPKKRPEPEEYEDDLDEEEVDPKPKKKKKVEDDNEE